jgi:predicted amidohydrolase
MWAQPVSPKAKWLQAGGLLVLCALVLPTENLTGTHFSKDRTLNEIANNGAVSFVDAGWTHNLDFATFYRTLPREEAYARVRTLLTSPTAQFVGGHDSIRRKVTGDPARPKLNVVILLEESLGSEFWG